MTANAIKIAEVQKEIEKIWIEERKQYVLPIKIIGYLKKPEAESADIEYGRLKVFQKMLYAPQWKEVICLMLGFEEFESEKFGNFPNPIYLHRDKIIELLNSIWEFGLDFFHIWIILK